MTGHDTTHQIMATHVTHWVTHCQLQYDIINKMVDIYIFFQKNSPT